LKSFTALSPESICRSFNSLIDPRLKVFAVGGLPMVIRVSVGVQCLERARLLASFLADAANFTLDTWF